MANSMQKTAEKLVFSAPVKEMRNGRRTGFLPRLRTCVLGSVPCDQVTPSRMLGARLPPTSHPKLGTWRLWSVVARGTWSARPTDMCQRWFGELTSVFDGVVFPRMQRASPATFGGRFKPFRRFNMVETMFSEGEVRDRRSRPRTFA